MAWYFPVAGEHKWNRGSWMPNTVGRGGRTHAAIDIYAARGTSLVTPVGGTVIGRATTKVGGNWIKIRGDDGIEYYFAHMNSPAIPAKGSRVRAGQAIGFIGNSGSARTTSPHVHFTMKKRGKVLNPITWLESAQTVAPGAEFIPGVDGPYPPGQRPNDAGTPQGQDDQGGFSLLSPSEAVEGVFDEQDTEAPAALDTRQMLGSVLSAVSNAMSGGTRADYRSLGQERVPEGLVLPTEAGGQVSDLERVPPTEENPDGAQ